MGQTLILIDFESLKSLLIMIVEVFINSTFIEIESGPVFSSILVLCHSLIDKVNSKVAILRVELILQSKCEIEAAILWPKGLLIFR